jgi:hypothetical protein
VSQYEKNDADLGELVSRIFITDKSSGDVPAAEA